MQTDHEAGQVSIFGPDLWYGKMCREPSPAESGRARTSASSWKRSSELSAVPFMSLDLTPGHGNLLGESYWKLISPYAGGAWTLNTGVSPRGARESSLSRILQGAPPTKYYLSAKACMGILRRAFERGKALPKKLERALKIQAGLALPDGQITDIDAYHINQTAKRAIRISSASRSRRPLLNFVNVTSLSSVYSWLKNGSPGFRLFLPDAKTDNSTGLPRHCCCMD